MVAKNRSKRLLTSILALVFLLLLVQMSYTVIAKEALKDTANNLQQLRLADCDGTIRMIQPSEIATVFVLLGPECPISQQCTKAVNELAKYYSPKGFTFYGIIPGNYYSPYEIQVFKKMYQLSYAILMDTAYELTNILHGKITPQAIITNNTFKILYNGAIDNAYLELGRKNAHTTAHYLADALTNINNNLPVAIAQTVPIGCLIATKKNIK